MRRNAAIAIAACIAALPARADFAANEFPPYERCALCHGLFGVSHSAKFPNLAAQKPDYLEAQIRAFLSGARGNDGGQMAAIVTELKPEEIAVVVEWFSSQDAPEPDPSGDIAEGRAAFGDLGCAACHDNSAEEAPDVPYLSAQHSGYLAKQMADFRDGLRAGNAAARLHGTLLAQPDARLEAIARYLASEARP